MKEDLDIIITQIRDIDNDRFIEKLATITQKEMQKIKELFYEITQ